MARFNRFTPARTCDTNSPRAPRRPHPCPICPLQNAYNDAANAAREVLPVPGAGTGSAEGLRVVPERRHPRRDAPLKAFRFRLRARTGQPSPQARLRRSPAESRGRRTKQTPRRGHGQERSRAPLLRTEAEAGGGRGPERFKSQQDQAGGLTWQGSSTSLTGGDTRTVPAAIFDRQDSNTGMSLAYACAKAAVEQVLRNRYEVPAGLWTDALDHEVSDIIYPIVLRYRHQRTLPEIMRLAVSAAYGEG